MPAQKPGKPKGHVQNLRPITLLSMKRIVLAVCMKKRIVDKLDAEIPPSQAAYRAGRSSTEYVFAAKVLMEKAITSANYPIHLLMLDMSKAFDTVYWSTLIQELAKVLTNTQLKIRCRNEKSDAFETDTGVPEVSLRVFLRVDRSIQTCFLNYVKLFNFWLLIRQCLWIMAWNCRII